MCLLQKTLVGTPLKIQFSVPLFELLSNMVNI